MPKFGYRWQAEVRTLSAPTPGGAADAPVDATPAAPATDTARQAAAPAAPRSRHGRPVLVAIVLIVLAAAAVAWALRHPSTPARADASPGALVRPLDVTATPPQDWLRLGGMDALATRLRAGGLRVPPSEAVPPASISSSTARRRSLRRAGTSSCTRVRRKASRPSSKRTDATHCRPCVRPATACWSG
jgi:hypothetical protein